MRKLICISVFLIGVSSVGFAQYERGDIPHNEINYNIANTLAIASVEVGYNYFLDSDQSVGLKILIDDRRNYHRENHGKEFNTNSIRLNYTYYFGRFNPGSGIYIQPFMKYRFGDFKEPTDDFVNSPTRKTNMDAFMIGLGLGYEWNLSNSFVFGPFANIARNFSDEVKNRFSAFDFNAGLNIGYRF